MLYAFMTKEKTIWRTAYGGLPMTEEKNFQENEIKDIKLDNKFLHLAMSLTNDYISVYYLNILDNSYIEYGLSKEEKTLTIVSSGNDFFEDTIYNCRRMVYIDDQENFLASFKKENLIAALEHGDSFTLNYRLVENGEPVYYHLKTIRSIDDDDHIIIGVRNVDKQMRYQNTLIANSDTYNRIATALASRYEVIYYIDIETDEYYEYSSSEKYTQLKMGNHGDDFFDDTQKNMKKSIYEEDLPMMTEAMRKSRILNRLDHSGVFSITYRLKLEDSIEYVNLRAVKTTDSKHLVVGVSNIDESFRAEKDLKAALGSAMEQANRDELTGVKSKHAYANDINKLKDDIEAHTVSEYAIGVFDVNNLKMINDTLGHNAGDEYIRAACRMICRIFKHSPVYRIGGDEFAIILKGHDYAIRDSLMNELQTEIMENLENDLVTLAGGVAAYNSAKKESTTQVFNRADANMYDNKHYIKSLMK